MLNGLAAADPNAVWVMQGWLFFNDSFWTQPTVDAYIKDIPTSKIIILDLFADSHPVSRKFDLSGHTFIWSMLHNFGGNTNSYGRMSVLRDDILKSKSD